MNINQISLEKFQTSLLSVRKDGEENLKNTLGHRPGHFKVGTMANFLSWVFYHNKKNWTPSSIYW